LKELLATTSELEVKIGFLAGEIYKAAFNQEVSLKQLKQSLNQDENMLMMAVGWLARENKVVFRHDHNDIKIWTKNEN